MLPGGAAGMGASMRRAEGRGDKSDGEEKRERARRSREPGHDSMVAGTIIR
jgi:hypothetical protein